jgi:hypothetical protein
LQCGREHVDALVHALAVHSVGPKQFTRSGREQKLQCDRAGTKRIPRVWVRVYMDDLEGDAGMA